MTTSPAQTQAISRPLIRWSRVLSQLQDATLIIVSLLFVVIHVQHMAAGNWSSAPFAVENSVLIFLFLTRRKSRATSTRVSDWVFATVGGWGPLAFQLHGGTAGWLDGPGFALQMVGLSFAAVCFTGLGRSFGVVAANRGLKTGGPYRIVRHPIYACHLLTDIGFLMVNPFWFNFVLFSFTSTAQIMRIRAEERVLTESGDYANYKTQVRYRLIPGIY